MQKSIRQQSILSYAGLDKGTLLNLAAQALIRAESEVPERLSTFLPLFPFELIQNMDYVAGMKTTPPNIQISPDGFSIDPAEYHLKLSMEMPDLYEGDNDIRNHGAEGHYHGQSVFTVDKAWAQHFPQYKAFLGEKLVLYLIGGGHQAVAVPESLYPRCAGLLNSIEKRMQVTQNEQQFVQYALERISTGEAYNAEIFGADYLEALKLEPVMIQQSEITRLFYSYGTSPRHSQALSGAGAFADENPLRAEHVRQYIPGHYACDTFEASSITSHTIRICQPRFANMDFISDLWIPYQDVAEYIDKQSMELDMARLCEGYQIAPVYDPSTYGGRYPDSLLVVLVRERDIPVLASDVLNNPAYGSGMSPQGIIGRHIFIQDSAELLRQRKLVPESSLVVACNTALSPEAYQRAHAMAALQETKGKLMDALYEKELAFYQKAEDGRSEDIEESDEAVEALQKKLEAQSAGWTHHHRSGYDDDISYLRRKALSREYTSKGSLQDSLHIFELDVRREQSIRNGYAMRNAMVSEPYADVCLPAEPEPEPPVQSVAPVSDEEITPPAHEPEAPEAPEESETPETQEDQEDQEEPEAQEPPKPQHSPSDKTAKEKPRPANAGNKARKARSFDDIKLRSKKPDPKRKEIGESGGEAVGSAPQPRSMADSIKTESQASVSITNKGGKMAAIVKGKSED